MKPICLPCKGRWLRACEQTEGLFGGSKPPPYDYTLFFIANNEKRTTYTGGPFLFAILSVFILQR